MGGITPTASVLPGLSVWTKPSKEGSVTEANEHDSFFQAFGFHTGQIFLCSLRKEVCVVL